MIDFTLSPHVQQTVSDIHPFITTAPYAELILVCAMTDPSKHGAGGTTFVVERDAPGLRIGRTYRTIMDDGMTGELIFDNCRVPLDHT